MEEEKDHNEEEKPEENSGFLRFRRLAKLLMKVEKTSVDYSAKNDQKDRDRTT